MGSNNIKGLTVEIGGDVSKLTDSLKSVDTQLKSSASELRQVDKLLKLDPKNTELLAQKQQILSEAIGATRSRLDSLRTAQEQAKPRLENYDEWKQKNDVISASIEEVETTLRRLREAQEEADGGENTDGTQYAALKEQISAAEKQLKTLKKEQKAWYDECGRPISPESYRSLQREIASTEQQLKRYTQQQEDTSRAAEGLDKASEQAENRLEDAGDQAKETADSVEELGKESDKSAEKVSSFGDVLKGSLFSHFIASSLRELRDEMRRIGISAIEAGSNAETAMAKVSTIADTAALPMEDLQAQIIELSTKTGKSVSEIAESVYSAISGGVDTANAVAVVEKATQLATGGFTDTATAIDVLTTAINAYGLSADDAAKLSDYLLTTQNLGKTTVDELAGSMGKVIPLASAYGVQMDNLSSAYAIMTANGIATADSTTYIKSMLKELGDSGSTVAKALKKATEKTFAELNAEGKSLGDVLAILGDSVDGDTGKFNELWSSSEAGIGALSILGSGTEKYAQVLGAMRDSAGTAESAYVTMTDTYEHRSEELKNTLQNLEIEGFNAFKDSVKDAMGTVNKELQSAEAKAAAQKLGKTIGSAATELSKVAVKVLPVLADSLNFAVKNAGKLATAAISAAVAVKGFKIASTATTWVKSLTAAFQGFSAAVKANPIGLCITLIAGLVSAYSALDAAVDSNAEKMERLSKAYSEAADAALEAQRARASAARDISDEYDGYRDLIEELDGIVDANGRVKSGYEDRAAYITGRLSEVAGIEIEITDGVIQKYGELADMLDTVLLKKQAEALLSSGQSDYQAAKDAIESTETDEDGNYVAGSQAAAEQSRQAVAGYRASLADYDAKQAEFDALSAEYAAGKISENTMLQKQTDIARDMNNILRYQLGGSITRKEAVGFIDMAQQAAEDARLAYDANMAIIAQYEGLQNAVWAEDEGAMRDAISVFSAGQMTADSAALSSLIKQLEDQANAYATERTQSTEEGTTVTPAQLDASRELLYRAFYEAYSAADAEGASTEELQRLVELLSGSSGLSSDTVAAYAQLISGGQFADADAFAAAMAKLGVPSSPAPEDNGGGNDSGVDRFAAAMGRFQQFFADSPFFSNSSAMPLSVTNEADARVEAVLNDLLGVVSGMELTLVLDDGTLVARTIGKTNDALGVEVGREKRGALK